MSAELVLITRQGWGASSATEAFIQNRYSALPREKTNIQVHHTAGVDVDDRTPNRWDADEAAAYMRKLQVSRPDLGPLPYSVNLAANEDLSKVFVFQARGVLKVGAHTAGYNRSGVGLGVLGNFDKPDPEAAQVLVDAIETICRDFRDGGVWADRLIEGGSLLPLLGTVRNPAGWQAWGHRDTSPKTCPGNSLYPLLAEFSLEGGDDDMAILTDDEQRELQAFLQELKKVDSNVTFPRFLIPWFRKWSGSIPEHFAKKGEVLPAEETVKIIRAA